MKKAAIVCAAALLVVPSPALGRDFSCSNKAAEIRCEAGGCQVETQNFTPMQLTRRGRALSLCAYSACWEGRISFGRQRSGIHYLQSRVRRVGPPAPAEQSLLSVMFSPASGTAQINWGGFLSVLECSAGGADAPA